MLHRAIRPALVASALLATIPACAAVKDCNGTDSLKNNPAVENGKVTSSYPKTFFTKGETDDMACPASMAACQRKAFLVPGNSVLVIGRTGAFACVIYVNGRGVETDGWMAGAALTVDAPASAMPAQGWTGTWVRDEAKVTIKAGSAGALAIHGDATFGIHDPQRVKNGSVNIGEIAGVVEAKGNRLSFTMGDDGKTLPIDKGDDSTCKVWMQRAGDYLLLDDNSN